MRMSRRQRALIRQGLESGAIRPLAPSSWAVPSELFVEGVTPRMIAAVARQQRMCDNRRGVKR